MMKYDLIIKNGRIIDSAQGIDQVADLAITGGRVAGIGTYTEADLKPAKGVSTHADLIDATGCIVSAGFIDEHTHLYPLMAIGLGGDFAYLPSGVTSIVECGSAGAYHYEGFRQVTRHTLVNVKSYIYVSPFGLIMGPPEHQESLDPADFDEEKLIELFAKYGDELVGLKIRMTDNVVRGHGLAPLEATIAIAEKIGCNVMVHTTSPAVPMEDIASVLRKGDVLTHMNQGRGSTIIGDDGHVKPEILQARARGVYFDCGDGAVHMSLSVAQAAIADGFLPDSISTDLTTFGLYRQNHVFSLPFTMSRYLNLGLTINEVIKRVTENPAKQIGEEGKIGCLKPGAMGDVAVCKIVEKPTIFADCDAQTIVGNQLIKPLMTVKEGNIVYRDITFM